MFCKCYIIQNGTKDLLQLEAVSSMKLFWFTDFSTLKIKRVGLGFDLFFFFLNSFGYTVEESISQAAS